MSKINLVPITGAQQLSAINDNFNKVQEALNDKVLYRNNPAGEPNQVSSDVDMNNRRIYNLPQPVSPSEPVRFQDLGDVTALTEEARGYAESAASSATVATEAQTAAETASLSATNSATVATDKADIASDAAISANDSALAAQAAAESIGDVVFQTSDVGAILIPQGNNAERPTPPAGRFLLRGNTQNVSDYIGEYFDRVTTSWKTIADRSWVATQISTLQTTIESWVNQLIGYTIVYPNGGTAIAPANVSVNQRYEVNNPFPGKSIICQAEVLAYGKWTVTGWVYTGSSQGVMASEFDGKVVVQTAQYLVGQGDITGCPNPSVVGSINTPLPCRVKVWLVKGS